MNKNLGPKIKLLREQGLNYNEIVNELGCSKGTVAYHLGKGQKLKTVTRNSKNKNNNPYTRKIYNFTQKYTTKNKKIKKCKWEKDLYFKIRRYCSPDRLRNPNSMKDVTITTEDITNKFGENPICYLTGDKINIYETSSYHFDHIVPRSKGGDNSLENLGICTKEANQAKSDMTLDEFYNLCEKIIKNRNNKNDNE